VSLLYFVTPAHLRFEMTALCLDQRLDVIRTIAGYGIEGRVVIVADDANVDIARERGVEVVEQTNEYLGRKWNDGIEYAYRQGADYVVPIGSDSWIDPWYFAHMPKRDDQVRTSGLYAAVTADRLGTININRGNMPAGPYVITRAVLQRSTRRPVREEENNYTDGSMIAGMGKFRWAPRDLHPLQYVGFRFPPYMTSYRALMNRWGTGEHDDPWGTLATKYPADLVDRARVLMTSLLEVAA
jgi:hypothetical protein